MTPHGDRAQLADDAIRGEMASWVREGAGEDGLASHGVPLEQAGARAAALPLRSFETAAGAAASDQELANGSPLLAVLGIYADDERAWVPAGRPWGTSCCLPAPKGYSLRSSTRRSRSLGCDRWSARAIGRAGYPHVVLRIGYAPPVPPTPRRPLEAVLLD